MCSMYVKQLFKKVFIFFENWTVFFFCWTSVQIVHVFLLFIYRVCLVSIYCCFVGERSTEKKKYGIINTHAMKKDRLHKMEALLSKKEMEKIADIEFQVRDGSQSGNGLKDGWEVKLDEFVAKL